ncbi:MAG TPA: DPP IV N-terminal domain-containing protein [Thermoanaerobaculia bacterium]|nr:DPP IV N-terminal domain-containing protein [Thermoanaerobaculia bacterium]
MRPIHAALLACCLCGPAALAEKLTDDAMFAADFSGLQPDDLAWSPDGRYLTWLWGEDEEKVLWRLDATTGRSEALLRLANEKLELDEYLWSPRGDALLLVAGGDLYLLPLEGKLRRLTETGEDEKQPGFSPDGSRLAFVRGFDLHVLDLGNGRETALTRDGEENVFLNGTTDWVYWEEIWDREAAGYWWSPDGKRIAYYRFDEREVPSHPLVDEIPQAPALRWQKYPKPGEKNPKVRVGVIGVEGGKTTWMSTGEEDVYLARVSWTPDGEAVAIQRLNRDQTRLDLLRCSAMDGACSPLLTETRPTWINLGYDFRFLDDGRFLWGSEGDGWRRLYLHDRDGRLVRPVTPEGWGIASIEGVTGHGIIVTAFRTEGMGPADRLVYRAGLSRESWEPLAAEPGTHAAVVASTGSWAHTRHDADTPPRSEVRTASTTIPLPYTPPSGYDPAALPKWEYLFIPGPKGVRLPARLLKPAGFDPGRRYPAIMYHYGGPASQVVINRWDNRRRDLWHKKMAERGFVVLQVDNTSSFFFGKTGEDRDHRRFGPANLEAQLAGVEYLKSLGWVDTARIGLWGWSGGGYHTLYALLQAPGVWKAGIAGAPVTDWNLYDSIWTERYLDTPQDNPDGYRESSPTTHAEKLKDHLLIIHGFADDNVHPQNTVVFIDRLIAAGIPFEDAFYPGQTHSFRGPALRHWYARMTEFFERTLRADPNPRTASE